MLAGSSGANEVDEPANAELASADAAQKRTQDVVRRLAAFLTRERSEVLTFRKFEAEVLQHTFRPALGADGVLKPDIFHYDLCIEDVQCHAAQFFDALVRQIDRIPNAFARMSAFDNQDFYSETRHSFVWSSWQDPHAFRHMANAFGIKARQVYSWQLQNMCLQHLRDLLKFNDLLLKISRDDEAEDPEGTFFANSDVFQRLIDDPPPQFESSLRALQPPVLLSDMSKLSCWHAHRKKLVSMRTFQVAAKHFVDEHLDALIEACSGTITTLRKILDENIGICLETAHEEHSVMAQAFHTPGSAELSLPAHLCAGTVYLVPGVQAQMQAALPAYRLVAFLQQMAERNVLVPSAMTVGMFMPVVRRLLEESHMWNLDDAQRVATHAPVPAPVLPPAPAPVAAPAAAAAPRPVTVAVAATAASCTRALQCGIPVALRLLIDTKAAHLRDPTRDLIKLTFMDVATTLKSSVCTAERLRSILQKIPPFLRKFAEHTEVRVEKPKRRYTLVGSLDAFEKMYTLARTTGPTSL